MYVHLKEELCGQRRGYFNLSDPLLS